MGESESEPPRLILFLVADQLRADHVGFGGGLAGLTPNLDALAARGVVFDRAYATNPTCMPSRASIATGRWPSVHGTRTNGIPLDPTAETFMGALRRAGWFNAAIGKLHLQTMGWPAEAHQLSEIAATNPDTADPALIDARSCWNGHRADYEYIERHRAALVEMPDDYYGFAHVDLISGHGDRASGHYWHWARCHGADPSIVGGHENSLSRSSRWDQVWESQVPAELSTSRFVADRTIAQIEAAANRDAPTFIFASFPDPHHPFCPPAPYAGIIDEADVELPATFDQDPARLPPHLQVMLRRRGVPNADPMMAFAIDEHQYREAYVHQAGLLRMLDDAVGGILKALDRSGLGERALIVFTADHGDLFGDHGLMLKHHVHYSAVTRVPLVVAGPELRHHRASALVSLADLAPTVLEYAEASAYRGIQGRSLLAVLTGRSDEHRRAVLIEEDLPFGTEGLLAPVRMRSLVTDSGRLTVYRGEQFGECYSFEADPEERFNLHRAGAPTALERDLRDQLFDELLELSDEGLMMRHGA